MENVIVKKEGMNTINTDIIDSKMVEAGWKDKIELVKSLVAKGCSNDEFGLLVHLANQYELDPLKREIWAVKYGYSPAQIFVSRDGFLSIAHKSGQFNGMNTVFKEPSDPKNINDTMATCTVYRKDMEHPIEVTIKMGEYNTNMSVWKTKPRTMLQKVAESQALRRAFNVAGVYSPEEFDQVKEEQNTKTTNKLVKPIVVENKPEVK